MQVLDTNSTMVSSYSPCFPETNCISCGRQLIDPDGREAPETDYEVCVCCGFLFCRPDCWNQHKDETLHKNAF